MVEPNPLFHTIIIKKQATKMMASIPVGLIEDIYRSQVIVYIV